MKRKEKRLPTVALIFSIFLFIVTVINLVRGNIGAAISGFGAGCFFFILSRGLRDSQRNDKGEK